MNDFVIGLIRTYVPIVVGATAAWFLASGIKLDVASQTGAIVAITGLLQAAYYTAVRVAAKKWPWVDGLLGVNKAPTY